MLERSPFNDSTETIISLSTEDADYEILSIYYYPDYEIDNSEYGYFFKLAFPGVEIFPDDEDMINIYGVVVEYTVPFSTYFLSLVMKLKIIYLRRVVDVEFLFIAKY